jgi:hypothetical protein
LAVDTFTLDAAFVLSPQLKIQLLLLLLVVVVVLAFSALAALWVPPAVHIRFIGSAY